MPNLFILAVLIFIRCSSDPEAALSWQDSTVANLRFDIQLSPDIYRLSNFGEPPQMALWLENENASEIRTLWVSNRLARGIWVGKVVCPTALPYWISRRELETGGEIPSFLKPLPDGITGATPKDKLSIYTQVPPGSNWRYFLELNVSGDYNESFTASQPNGEPDPDGNGQPSLVYSGRLKAETGWVDSTVLIGRTEQAVVPSMLNHDLVSITSASQVLRKLEVTYLSTDVPSLSPDR
ncbi:MAG: hypothetical protein U9Q77_03045 [Candidatus Marinimicrobia bacterium]|nr:hypothetical protein [Candidatus Neomarinimicrobiota bacterium]